MAQRTIVTRDWTKAKLSDTEPLTAHEEYHVSGEFTADADALAATDWLSGLRPAQRGEGHSYSDSLACKGPRILAVLSDKRYYVVGCDFDENAPAESHPNPLLRDPKWTWETVYVSEMTDRDASGKLIANAAGDPVPLPRDIHYKKLVYMQNESHYDEAKCENFENCVNAQDMIVAGRSVKAEHMRLVSALPMGEQSPTQRFARMAYVFEIVFGDQLGKYPFQHRFLNESEWGWWVWSGDSQKRRAKFSDGKGNTVQGSIRLNIAGRPLDGLYDMIKVGLNNQDPVPPPAGVVPGYFDYEYSADRMAVWLFNRKCLPKDLRLLGLR